MSEQTPRFSLNRIAEGQAGGENLYNESINLLDTLTHLAIEDKDLTAPPGSPADGAAYLVAASATGAWAGQDGKIAIYSGGWLFRTPQEGMMLWIKDEDLLKVYNGSVWRNIAHTA